MALDADTGKVVWEYKFNIFQSDVPPHRVGWASPAADPETGNIYALSGGAQVIALSRDGKLLWDRSIGEEFAAFTTHGGRTMSPLVDGNLVIVSAADLQLGHRGEPRRTASSPSTSGPARSSTCRTPAAVPYDTAYASPLIATINGMRLLIAGLGDGGDPRHQAADRRKGLELRRGQARHQHRRRRQGHERHRVARRREPRQAPSSG